MCACVFAYGSVNFESRAQYKAFRLERVDKREVSAQCAQDLCPVHCVPVAYAVLSIWRIKQRRVCSGLVPNVRRVRGKSVDYIRVSRGENKNRIIKKSVSNSSSFLFFILSNFDRGWRPTSMVVGPRRVRAHVGFPNSECRQLRRGGANKEFFLFSAGTDDTPSSVWHASGTIDPVAYFNFTQTALKSP